MNTIHLTSPSYHSQSNAKVERFHRTLMDIAKLVENDKDNWNLYLTQALAAGKFSIYESSIFLPYQILFRYDVVLPSKQLNEAWYEVSGGGSP